MIYLDLILNLSLLVALSIVSGFIEKRRPVHRSDGALWQGLLFGGAAVIGMLRPLDLGAGLIFDGRSVMLSLGALFFGPWAGAVAGSMAIACRLWLGGLGTLTGVSVILSSLGIGIWAHFRRKPFAHPYSTPSLYLFGLAVHLAMLALMFTLPLEAALTTLRKIGLPVLLLYPLATVLAGKVLADQTFAARLVEGLRQATQDLDVTLQSIGEGVIVTDLEGRVVRLNPEAARLTGWPAEDAIGKPLTEVFRVEDARTREPIANPVAKVLEAGQPVGLANHSLLHSRDGAARHITDNAAPIRRPDGRVSGVVLVFRDVSESYRTQEALRRSEESYRRLFEDHAAVKLIIDPATGAIRDANPAAVRFYGWPRKRLMQMNIRDINTLPPEAIAQEMEKARSQKRIHFEFRHRRADGSVRDVEVFSSRITAGGSEFLHSIVHDVTEHRQMEERLRQSDQLLADLAAQVPGVVYQYRLHPDGRSCFPYASPGMEAIYEISPEAVREDATPVFGRLHPEDHDRVAQAIQASARTLEPFHCEFRVVLPRQGLRWRVSNAQPQRLKDGGTLWHGIIQDITARKEAEISLVESEARYRNLIMHSPDAIFVNQDDRVILVNHACERLFGARGPEELMGKSPYELFHPDFHDVVRERIHRMRDFGETAPLIEERIVRLDGRAVDVEALAAPFPYQGANAIHVILRDISGRKQAEAERERLAAQLLQAQKMESVGRLAGGVAHDFNNMLTVILGHTEILLDDADPGEALHADLTAIREAAETSARITRQLLAFARQQTIVPQVLDLNATVEGMLKMLRRLIGEDIDLAWHPAGHLWPVTMDPSQIDQILANLCVNARDAIEGVGRVTIETANVAIDKGYGEGEAAGTPGAYAMLAVSDSGCGMNRETLAKIFDPFFTTKEVGRGTGLGLATVYGIVKQNGGFINVYSEPGRGTTFRIYLPRAAEDGAPEDEEGPAETLQGGTETILLVEDEPGILNLGRKILERLGYTVLTAETPAAALQKAGDHIGPIHLVMTDVVMPGMNGRELAERIGTMHPGIRCLYMSGYTANVIVHHGVLDPGVHFLQKPFSVNTLAAKVREVLDET